MFSVRRVCSFLLRGQKKRTKEKATFFKSSAKKRCSALNFSESLDSNRYWRVSDKASIVLFKDVRFYTSLRGTKQSHNMIVFLRPTPRGIIFLWVSCVDNTWAKPLPEPILFFSLSPIDAPLVWTEILQIRGFPWLSLNDQTNSWKHT